MNRREMIKVTASAIAFGPQVLSQQVDGPYANKFDNREVWGAMPDLPCRMPMALVRVFSQKGSFPMQEAVVPIDGNGCIFLPNEILEKMVPGEDAVMTAVVPLPEEFRSLV